MSIRSAHSPLQQTSFPFVQTSQQHTTEVNGPDGVISLLETDMLGAQRIPQKDSAVSPFDVTVGRNPADLEVTRIDDLGLAERVGPFGGPIQFTWKAVLQRLVRPIVVVLCSKPIETALLRLCVARHRPSGLGLESFVHPLVRTILLGPSGHDQNGLDVELDPPNREPRQARQSWAGKRRTVVGPNCPWKTVLSKEPLELPACSKLGGRFQRLASQQVPTQRVAHRQRIAIRPITQPKLPLEVSIPKLIRRAHGCNIPSFNVPRSCSPSTLHHSFARQQVTDRTCRWEAQLRMLALQPSAQLSRAPCRVSSARRNEHYANLFVHLLRRMMRSSRAVLKSHQPFRLESLHELVARLSADAVQLAQLSHCVTAGQVRVDKPLPFDHGIRLSPTHTPSLLVKRRARKCYPCRRSVLLPMSPVRTPSTDC